MSVDDEVFGNAPRATAQNAVLEHFAAKPAAMSWAEAAALPVAAETAARASSGRSASNPAKPY